MVKWRKQTR